MSQRRQVPGWLIRILKPGGRVTACGTPPSDLDTNITVAALLGSEPKVLRRRFSSDMVSCREALIRVRDAVLAGDIPAELQRQCPWFEKWLREPARKRGKSQASETVCSAAVEALAVPAAPITFAQQRAIEAITDHPYHPLDSEQPDSLPKFLSEAKARFAVAAGPLALRRLSEQVAAGQPLAVTQAREFLYGSNRGPVFALQQNFTGTSSTGRGRSGDSFADVILQYEKEHPEESGEITLFDSGHLVEESEEDE